MKEKKLTQTITEQFDEIVKDMCEEYCKWPLLWDEEAEGMELCESDVCKNCPLNRI